MQLYLYLLHVLLIGLLSCGPGYAEPYVNNPQLLQKVSFNQPNFDKLIKFADFSSASYKGHAAIQSIANKYAFKITTVNTLQESKVSYFLATNEKIKTHIISVRGTSNIENAILDFDAQLVLNKHLDTKLHRGFSQAANNIYKQLKSDLDREYRIHFTGHSLGGAVAVILAMQFYYDEYVIGDIVTFGQPKITNVSGALKFRDLDIIRVVTDKDIVPLVPPVDIFDLSKIDIYWHMGTEIVLFPGRYYAQLSGLKSMMRGLSFINKSFSEEDLFVHMLSNYSELLTDKLHSNQVIPYDDHEAYTNPITINNGKNYL